MKWLLWVFGGACLLLVFAFHQGMTANPTSRLLTVYGLVEDHHLYADRWKGETGDSAIIDGHTYSDKAPLSSFMVVPVYWAFRRIEGGPQRPSDKDFAGHLGILLCSSVPFAIFAILLLLRAKREGAEPHLAVWLTLGAAFGTCLADYGGMYFGHMLAGTLFLLAYVLACEREEHFVLAGFFGGLTVIAEYPLVITQALIFGYLLLGPDRWRRAFRYGLGALPSAIAMVGYNRWVTGKWLDFPYSHVNDGWIAMKTHFGVRLPDASAMWELVFGQYRGLAFYASLLLLLFPAMLIRFRGPRRRQVLALTIMGCYLLFVSSYFKWDGGWCTGPRHLTPLIVLGLYEGLGAFVRMKRGRWVYALLAGWGTVLILCANAIDGVPSDAIQRPAFEVFFPDVWKGQLGSHNVFTELGMKSSRLPYFIWIALFVATGVVFGWWLTRIEKRSALPAPVAPPLPAAQPAA